MHAVIQNDRDMVDMLSDLGNLDAQDREGKTVVHYVVNPLPFGSYENVDLLELLAKKGCKLDIKDSAGNTPLHYAHLQVIIPNISSMIITILW